MSYDPAQSEPRWQKAWDEAGSFVARRDDRPKFYVLEMFPYPSGRIHIGHVRNYTLGDVVARFRRAQPGYSGFPFGKVGGRINWHRRLLKLVAANNHTQVCGSLRSFMLRFPGICFSI